MAKDSVAMHSTDAPILITGATGGVGRPLVDELLARGAHVRALTRDPAKAALPRCVHVVRADLAGEARLPDELFADVRRMFVFPAEEGVDRLVRQASDAGVEHFVLLSSLAAAGEHDRDLRSPSYHHHLAVERAVKDAAADWTVLRPGTFANNLLSWKHPLSQGDVVYGPYAQSAQAPIHEADVAAVAAVALTEEGHRHKTYAMTGPEALSRVEQLAVIGEAIGRSLTFEEISPEKFEEAMRPVMPAAIIQMLLDYWSDTLSEPDRIRHGVEEATGRTARTLSEWAADHTGDFSARPAAPQAP